MCYHSRGRGWGTSVTEAVDGHRFNDDLLANPTDIAEARKRFPALMHVLDDPEVRWLFLEYDEPANAAKKASRKWGPVAILLASLALFGAAAAPLFHGLSDETAKAIEWLTAVSGVASIAIGVWGLLWFRAKVTWLQNRLVTERLRQFHFQAFICRINDIIESLASDAAAKTYVEKRVAWFADFRARVINGRLAEFTDLVSDNPTIAPWLYSPCAPILKNAGKVASDDPVLKQIFDAYCALRIRHQLRYSGYKLSEATGILPTSIRAQIKLFSNTALFAIVALLLIHLGIAVTVLLGGKVFSPPQWIHVIVIWIAIIALAARALEEGLQPTRELERYRRYGFAVKKILDSFEAAKSPLERLELMREMEQLVFDEMVDFLKTHNEARYVM